MRKKHKSPCCNMSLRYLWSSSPSNSLKPPLQARPRAGAEAQIALTTPPKPELREKSCSKKPERFLNGYKRSSHRRSTILRTHTPPDSSTKGVLKMRRLSRCLFRHPSMAMPRRGTVQRSATSSGGVAERTPSKLYSSIATQHPNAIPVQ